MRVFNSKQHQQRKEEIMKKAYDYYAEYGLSNVGIKDLGKACNMAPGVIYNYFDSLDDLILQSTEYCMSKVEDEFMEKAPKDISDLKRFLKEIPYWTEKTHGKKYRLMYQVYSNPKYRESGKKFFEGVNLRYTEYAKQLENKLHMPYQEILGFIFIFVRACVHYALFQDEFYLKAELSVLTKSLSYVLQEDITFS